MHVLSASLEWEILLLLNLYFGAFCEWVRWLYISSFACERGTSSTGSWNRLLAVGEEFYSYILGCYTPSMSVCVCVGEWTLGSSSLSLCVWNMGDYFISQSVFSNYWYISTGSMLTTRDELKLKLKRYFYCMWVSVCVCVCVCVCVLLAIAFSGFTALSVTALPYISAERQRENERGSTAGLNTCSCSAFPLLSSLFRCHAHSRTPTHPHRHTHTHTYIYIYICMYSSPVTQT